MANMMPRPIRQSRRSSCNDEAQYLVNRNTAIVSTALLCGALRCLGLPAGAAPGGFSYTPPAGWQALDLKDAPKTLRSLASPAGNAAATFSVQDISSPLLPDRYLQKLLTDLKASAPQTRLFSRGGFTTASGLHGCRAVFDEASPGGSVHFVVCVFPGLGRHRLLVAGIWPASETAKYHAPIDQALKTFKLLH